MIPATIILALIALIAAVCVSPFVVTSPERCPYLYA
jgi:hypothetical protein